MNVGTLSMKSEMMEAKHGWNKDIPTHIAILALIGCMTKTLQ